MASLKRHLWFILPALVAGPLQGCATPASEPGPAPEEAPVEAAGEARQPRSQPELTLNLPRKPENCPCPAEEPRDQTFLERGYSALSRGDYIGAVQHFQRYQRLEAAPEAQWEAGMAIAYVSMLPNSPFFEPEAARNSLERLDAELTTQMQVHETSLLMRDSLEAMTELDRHIAELESNNAILREDLKKREEALKRLRELTLGQRGARQ